MAEKENRRIHLRTYNNDYHQAYLELADHPHEQVSGCVKRSEFFHNLIEGYIGPSIIVDFNKEGIAIGIEIQYSYEDGSNDDRDCDA